MMTPEDVMTDNLTSDYVLMILLTRVVKFCLILWDDEFLSFICAVPPQVVGNQRIHNYIFLVALAFNEFCFSITPTKAYSAIQLFKLTKYNRLLFSSLLT